MIAALGSIVNIGWRVIKSDVSSSDSSDEDSSDELEVSSSDSSDKDKSGGGLSALGPILFVTGSVLYSLVNLIRLASSRSVEYDADSFAKSIGAGDSLIP